MSPGTFKAFLSPTHQAAAQFGGQRSIGTFQTVISLFKKCLLLYYKIIKFKILLSKSEVIQMVGKPPYAGD